MGDYNTLKSFPNPRDCDPNLDQTKLSDLLPLTINGVLAAPWCSYCRWSSWSHRRPEMFFLKLLSLTPGLQVSVVLFWNVASACYLEVCHCCVASQFYHFHFSTHNGEEPIFSSLPLWSQNVSGLSQRGETTPAYPQFRKQCTISDILYLFSRYTNHM